MGLIGCGGNEVTNSERNMGDYSENLYTWPDKDSAERIEIMCDGANLRTKSIQVGDYDESRIYLNDPACDDGVLTKADDITGAVAQSALTFSDT